MIPNYLREDVRKRRLVYSFKCCRATLVKHDSTTTMIFINAMEGLEAHRRSWANDEGTEKTVTWAMALSL